MYFQPVEKHRRRAFNTRGQDTRLSGSRRTRFLLLVKNPDEPPPCRARPRCSGASSETRVQVESNVYHFQYQSVKPGGAFKLGSSLHRPPHSVKSGPAALAGELARDEGQSKLEASNDSIWLLPYGAYHMHLYIPYVLYGMPHNSDDSRR